MTNTLLKLNLSVALADTINTYMMEFEAESRAMGKELKYDARQRFSLLQESSSRLRKASKAVALDGYSLKSSTLFCNGSDFLHDLLLLIADKVGDNPSDMERLLEIVKNFNPEKGE